ncbi:MAG: guanylate kinase [Chloroflexi bacterium]|nr:guanylate kinase [Chloroflexota bacterium]
MKNSVDPLDSNPVPVQQALVVVISGPSGVGKDVMIERMMGSGRLGFHFTVTATTRDPRPGERDGINHHFKTVDEFMTMIGGDELLEWAQVYDNYYGVPKQQIRDALGMGKHVIIRVDVQGANRLRELMPEALLIFIVPPSLDVLQQHLEKRGVDSDKEMQKRLVAATTEINQASLFDYSVTNEEDRLDETVDKVVSIIESEALRNPPRVVSI